MITSAQEPSIWICWVLVLSRAPKFHKPTSPVLLYEVEYCIDREAKDLATSKAVTPKKRLLI